MNRSLTRLAGFTLIELLIVVAIIAILAAIAVPNFLEAQSRSKISRTMADMRSTGLAITAYKTDNIDYPNLGNYVGFLLKQNVGIDDNIGILLTSPISYLTTIPIDNFNTAAPIWGKEDAGVPKSFVYTVRLNNDDRWGFFNWAVQGLSSHDLRWIIESAGPDVNWWTLVNVPQEDRWAGYVYDPSNGTISNGMLSYSNQGFISPIFNN